MEDDFQVPDYVGRDTDEGIQDVVIGKMLSLSQKYQLEEMLEKHVAIFTNHPGQAITSEYRIPLKTDEIVQSKPYQIPFA